MDGLEKITARISAAADAEIENGASPEDCARAVEEAYYEAVCD